MIRKNMFTLHAACRETHAVIDGLREMMAAHALAPEAVERLVVLVCPAVLKAASVTRARTELEAKFSVSHVAACVLAGLDTADDAAYAEELLTAPARVAWLNRIEVRPSEDIPEPAFAAFGSVTRSGERLATRYDGWRAFPGHAAQAPALERTFMRNTVPALGEARADWLKGRIGAFAEAADAGAHFADLARGRARRLSSGSRAPAPHAPEAPSPSGAD
ncbi:MAG: MmgE/PrpD family protein [Caulobacterales bacterium]|nr:MmgE/PrpD family protein [Caulobacterales bacterium]